MARLAISALTLSHFRSHRALRLTLDGRPVAIYGPNGAGKTNILEAVSLLSPGRGLRRAATDDIARKPEALGWKVMADIAAPDAGHHIETWAEPTESRQVRIDGKAATQTALGRIVRILWLVPAMDRLWIEAAEGRRRFLDRLTLSFHPDHAEVSLAYEKAMRDRNRLLRDQIGDAGWFGALEAQMAEAGAAIIANRAAAVQRLTIAQVGAETAFPQADLSITSPEPLPDGATALAQAFAEGRRRDMAAGRTLTGPHRADLATTYTAKGVPADQCSTGEQKALLISLILANARALAADLGAPPILLLDEVAAHLDATRRAALYDEIAGLGVQAFMTATDHALFDTLGARADVRCYRNRWPVARLRGNRMTITLDGLLLYCGALVILFLTPGPVWVAIIARGLSGGFSAAWPLAVGVAIGDLVWPLAAIFGLSWILSVYAGFMDVLRWIAVAIFLLMGWLLIRNADRPITANSRLTHPGRWAGFAAGIAVILGNPKAILFYMGVLPGFFDLRHVTGPDIAAILAVSVIIPMTGNLIFAVTIDRVRRILSSPAALRRMNLTAGVLLIVVAAVIAVV